MRGTRQSPAGEASVVVFDLAVVAGDGRIDHRATLAALLVGQQVEPPQYIAHGTVRLHLPADSMTTSVASRATSATEWLT